MKKVDFVNSQITQNWEAANTTAFLNPIVTGVTRLAKTHFEIRALLKVIFPK
jgi:hypothetical protein